MDIQDILVIRDIRATDIQDTWVIRDIWATDIQDFDEQVPRMVEIKTLKSKFLAGIRNPASYLSFLYNTLKLLATLF